jgi:hypothetical protein
MKCIHIYFDAGTTHYIGTYYDMYILSGHPQGQQTHLTWEKRSFIRSM